MRKFNVRLALTMAKLSQIAYIDGDIVQPLTALGFRLVKRLGKIHDLSGFICESDDFAAIVFQGTDPRDWETIKEDLKCWHTRADHVAYADGFYEAYRELWPEFVDFTVSNTKPLYITGHSLGGAIANILALNLSAGIFEACYTFGAPKICGLSGRKLDDGKAIYRLVHENDIVPHFPLAIMGYWPIGELRYITSDYKILTGWRAALMRLTWGVLPLILNAVTNHFIDSYIHALSVIVGEAPNANQTAKDNQAADAQNAGADSPAA